MKRRKFIKTSVIGSATIAGIATDAEAAYIFQPHDTSAQSLSGLKNGQAPILVFPLRIETRIIEGGKKLAIRVFPDDILTRSHQRYLRRFKEADGTMVEEPADGISFWKNIKKSKTDNEKITHWESLTKKYGTSRAVWIAKSTKDQKDNINASGQKYPVVYTDCLPNMLTYSIYEDEWITEISSETKKVQTWFQLGPDFNKEVDRDINEITHEYQNGLKWISDFEEACRIGLGCVFDIAETKISGRKVNIFVMGVRTDLKEDENNKRISELLANHYYADTFDNSLEILPIGIPTNNTEEGYSGFDFSQLSSHESFRIFIQPLIDNKPLAEGTDKTMMVNLLGLDENDWKDIHFENKYNDCDYQTAKAVNALMWYKYFSGTNPFETDGFITGISPIPTLRIGMNPYGVLVTGELPKGDSQFDYYKAITMRQIVAALGEEEKDNILLKILMEKQPFSFMNDGDKTLGIKKLIDGLNPNRPFGTTAKEMLQHWELIKRIRGKDPESIEIHIARFLSLLKNYTEGYLSSIYEKQLIETRKSTKLTYFGAYGFVENLEIKADSAKNFQISPPKQWVGAPIKDANQKTSFGFIQTPSATQAKVAAVLQHGYNQNTKPNDENIYALNLTSERVRDVMHLVRDTRGGRYIGELLGYQFERGLQDIGAATSIQDFRKTFPLKNNPNIIKNDVENHYLNVTDGFEMLKFMSNYSIKQLSSLNIDYSKQLIIDEFNSIIKDESKRPNYNTIYDIFSNSTANDIYKLIKDKDNEKKWEGNQYGESVAIKFGQLKNLYYLLGKAVIGKEIYNLKNTMDALGDMTIVETLTKTLQGNHLAAHTIANSLQKGDMLPEFDCVKVPRPFHTITQRAFIGLKDDIKTYHNPKAQIESELNSFLNNVVGKTTDIYCVVGVPVSKDNTAIKILGDIHLKSAGIEMIELLYMDTKKISESNLINRLNFFAQKTFNNKEATIWLSERNKEKKYLQDVIPIITTLQNVIIGNRPLKNSDIFNDSRKDDFDTNGIIDATTLSRYKKIYTDLTYYQTKLQEHLNTLCSNFYSEIQKGFPKYKEQLSKKYPNLKLPESAEILCKNPFEEEWEDLFLQSFHKNISSIKNIQELIIEFAVFDKKNTLPEYFANREDIQKAFEDIHKPSNDFSNIPNKNSNIERYRLGQHLVSILLFQKYSDLMPTHNVVVNILAKAKQVIQLISEIRAKIKKPSKELKWQDYEQSLSSILGSNFKPIPPINFSKKRKEDFKSVITRKLNGWHSDKAEWLADMARFRKKIFDLERLILFDNFLNKKSKLVLQPFQYFGNINQKQGIAPWVGVDYNLINKTKDYNKNNVAVNDSSIFGLKNDYKSFLIITEGGIYANQEIDIYPDTIVKGIFIDEWIDTVPSKEINTGVSFHYNAPNAEAPQALLLMLNTPNATNWEWKTLVEIFKDTLTRIKFRDSDNALKKVENPNPVLQSIHIDLLPPINCITADPAWMLNRQWRAGEFQAEDAGSPLASYLNWDVHNINKIALKKCKEDKLTAEYYQQTFNKNIIPLESIVERELIDWENADAYMRLKFANIWYVIAKEIVGINHPDPEIKIKEFIKEKYIREGKLLIQKMPLRDDELRELIDFVAINKEFPIFDGVKLYQSAKRSQKDAVWSLGNDPYYSGLNFNHLLQVFINTIDLLYNIPPYSEDSSKQFDGWCSENLEYTFEIAEDVAAENKVTLVADEYHQGNLNWYNFDLKDSYKPSQVKKEAFLTPVNIDFKGMPNKRWWSFEDAALNILQLQNAPSDLAGMMVSQFMLMYSNDWFVIPLPQEFGTMTKINSLLVKDTFGCLTAIKPATESSTTKDNWQTWNLFNHTVRSNNQSDYNKYTGLYLPSTILDSVQNEPIEEVLFGKDEAANMVWAIETITKNEWGRGTPIFQKKTEASENQAIQSIANKVLTYIPLIPAPENWIPFIPVIKNLSYYYRRARMMYHKTNEKTAPLNTSILKITGPLLIKEHEISDFGLIIQRYWRRTRWYDGRIYTWSAKKKFIGHESFTSGFVCDQVVQKADPS